jgi:hypothetical protein
MTTEEDLRIKNGNFVKQSDFSIVILFISRLDTFIRMIIIMVATANFSLFSGVLFMSRAFQKIQSVVNWF